MTTRLVQTLMLTLAATVLAAASGDAQSPPRKGVKPPAKPGSTFKECRNCPDMVVVPPGAFTIGSPASEPERRDNEPQKRITLARAFAIGRTEVTWDFANRVFRDGTFMSNPYMQRSARRGAPYPATRRGRNYLGFRVARTLD